MKIRSTSNIALKAGVHRSAGITLIELMVALAIGSFLIIGAVQVYSQSRQAYVVNESIARVQETAQFAMDTIEADLRMASNWGKTSRGDAIEGRWLAADVDPLGLLTAETAECGEDWVLNLERPVSGHNNSYGLGCDAHADVQVSSDTVTIRRARVDPTVPPLTAGRIRIQTTRIQGQLFDGASIPTGFDPDPDVSETHDLLVNSYYVTTTSDLIGGVPTLRRKTLVAGDIQDQEVAPGVENLQVQFGVDVDRDNTVDRYVNPDDPILDPDETDFIPTARVMTARIWLIVRSIDREVGITHGVDSYAPGDIDFDIPDDDFRRLLVSKTILLRNART